ncbi:unnamed protein product [Adineta steineri]|uniref:Pleiotropic regulator 1 n=1 Tax=Adineta steineri TaxID=433720 RepID=A0A815G928_9BILA|nr:unnamed protein product [Adineta steineri]CAF3547207.1 unnamed protein product [Adineta steineri]
MADTTTTTDRPISVHSLVFRSLKRTHDLFLANQNTPVAPDETADAITRKIKAKDQYGTVLTLPKGMKPHVKSTTETTETSGEATNDDTSENTNETVNDTIPHTISNTDVTSTTTMSNALVLASKPQQTSNQLQALVSKKPASVMPKPQWHAPWKLMRVISGHLGWVRCVDVEPANEWFVTGAADRVIKIWDLASGTLKLSLTGHVSTVRGVAVSSRQPYLFSAGEDKQVKCWDLECNKVIRHYHGHLSAVYALSLHPTLDILVSCGRDSVARVWDMRTKAQIHCLTGHTNTVADVKTQAGDPSVVTGSHDSTIRFWDLIAGRTYCTLTHHKKSVRSLAIHPKWNTMASASPDNIKEWRFPKGEFIQNLSGHSAIVNSLASNADNVLVSGADNGSLYFWDWKTGYNFQRLQTIPQPGSIDPEMGIYAMTFDQSGSRLITCEADKTIKIYKEDETATEQSHPVDWAPNIFKRKRY